MSKSCINIIFLQNESSLNIFWKSYKNIFNHTNQHGASDSIGNFSALSNPADTKNVSCLGLCGRDISWAGYFQP